MGASFFVNGANSSIATMIALLVAAHGGTQSDVALIAACYSLGFLTGCFLAPKQIFRVGLIRAFAAAAAVVTITIIILDVTDGVTLWAFLRFTMGAAMAALLAIADSWINDRTPGELRGGVIATYGTAIGLASLVGQIVFLITDATADGFVLIFAVTTNIALVLVAATSSEAPTLEPSPKRSLFTFAHTSLSASLGAFSSGFMITALVSILPFYQTSHGVSENLVAFSLIALYSGRLFFQWPVGRLSDRMDRRNVLIGLTSAAAFLALLILWVGEGEGRAIGGDQGIVVQSFAFAALLLLGGMLYPIYSVSSALAFDRAEGRAKIDVATTLLALNSIGAIAGPFMVGFASNFVGDSALSVCVAIVCIGNALTAMVRGTIVEAPEETTPFVAQIPESSVEMVQAAAELVEEAVDAAAPTEAAERR